MRILALPFFPWKLEGEFEGGGGHRVAVSGDRLPLDYSGVMHLTRRDFFVASVLGVAAGFGRAGTLKELPCTD